VAERCSSCAAGQDEHDHHGLNPALAPLTELLAIRGLVHKSFMWNNFRHHVALQRSMGVDWVCGEDHLHLHADARCVN